MRTLETKKKLSGHSCALKNSKSVPLYHEILILQKYNHTNFLPFDLGKKNVLLILKQCINSQSFNMVISAAQKKHVFEGKKHVFEIKKHVFLIKNGLINIGLVSIKQLNKKRQP